MGGDTFHKVERGTKPYCKLNDDGVSLCATGTEVLAGEYGHCIVESVNVVHRTLASTFPFIVKYASGGEVVVLESGHLNTPREVDIFAIHKVAFVEKSSFFESIT